MSYTGFAIHDSVNFSDAKKIEFKPRAFGDKDVEVKVDHCGICGSDVHTVTNGWGGANFPVVPGHEIIGSVTKVGKDVKLHKVGDRVGVGAQADACWKCPPCAKGYENYCDEIVDTYNSFKNGELTTGGYANRVIANELLVFTLPPALDKAECAPLLCAGLTVYAPLVRNNIGPGKKVGVTGVGGLGHLGIQFAKALGAEVYALSRGERKKADCFKLGADHYIDTTVKDWSKPYAYQFDFILGCASANGGFTGDYFKCLLVFGSFISVGLPETPFTLTAQQFVDAGTTFGGSHLGNRQEMIDMLDIAAKHNIAPWCELLPINAANVKKGLEKTYNNDVRYRVTLTDYDKEFVKA